MTKTTKNKLKRHMNTCKKNLQIIEPTKDVIPLYKFHQIIKKKTNNQKGKNGQRN